MRTVLTALTVAAAMCAAAAASAQDGRDDGGAKKGTACADAAEEAFLKAYFAERELHDYAGAEKLYAEIAGNGTASHEVLARALLGRARSQRDRGRAEADATFARVEKEFGDVADVAKEAREARAAREDRRGPNEM